MDRKAALLILTVFMGCGGPPASGPIQVTRSQRGDTVVFLSQGTPPVALGNEMEIIWQSPELEDPGSMVAVESKLFIGDPTRVHLISISGGPARTFGRDGDGPGEFRSVHSVGAMGPDTLLVFDGRLHRISYLDRDGDLLGSVRVSTALPYVNPSRDVL